MRALFGAMLGLGASIGRGYPLSLNVLNRPGSGCYRYIVWNRKMLRGPERALSHPGMQALGYREGQNLIIYERHAEGDRARLQSLAAELVSARIEVIIVVGTDAAEAGREITSSIPIVMAGVGDPFATGFAASIARPGGNVTGFASGEMRPLKSSLRPQGGRPSSPEGWSSLPARSAHDRRFERLEDTAARLGTQFDRSRNRGCRNDLPTQFAHLISSGAEAFVVLANPSLDDLRGKIAELGLLHKVPGAGHQPYYVRAGLLLSYGPSLADLHARSATYVDKILKGAKPADLPVEQAERFRLAVDQRTANALGLTIPPTLLARADEVIE